MKRWLPLLAGAVVLVVVVVRLGTGPIRQGLAAIRPGNLAVALVLGGLITLGCAARWTVVARRLGLALTLPDALAACYRSQLLNTALPGGVLGDVHRGLAHGRAAADRGRALRAVAWERGLGQAFSLLATAVVLILLPSGLGSAPRWIGAGVLLLTAAAARLVRPRADLTALRPALPAIALLSVGVLAGTTALFLVAAGLSPWHAPLALLVLAVAALPVNVGGWGPREGAAAALFAATGLGAAQGLSASVTFAILGAVGNLPGLVVLVAGAARHVRRVPAHG